VKGFKKCCVYNSVDETDDDDDMLWNGNEEDGNVRSECEALTGWMETVTLSG